jgi:cullin-associated NEDD8-dissociated protein 1
VREAIVRLSSSTKGVKSLHKFLDQLLALLFEFTGTEEEGNRNVVAECLGKLALIDGARVIVALKDRVGSPKGINLLLKKE